MPIDSPPLDRFSSFSGVPGAQGEAAANLFITGLEYELAKPLNRLGGLARRERSRGVGDLGVGEGSSGGRCGFERGEEESAEGRVFTIERVLELVVGVSFSPLSVLGLAGCPVGQGCQAELTLGRQLTDNYRYSILKAVNVERSSDSEKDANDSSLWARGAQVGERTLQHPRVAANPKALTIGRNQSRPRPPSHSTHTNLSSTSPSPSPAPPGATLSRSSFPSDYCLPPSQLAPPLKLRLMIEVHLFYLLALQAAPSNPAHAERLWTKIVLIGTEEDGKDVGTKEGNGIIAKAQRQLSMQRQPDEAWKHSKGRSRSMSASLTVSSSSSVEASASRRGEGARGEGA